MGFWDWLVKKKSNKYSLTDEDREKAREQRLMRSELKQQQLQHEKEIQALSHAAEMKRLKEDLMDYDVEDGGQSDVEMFNVLMQMFGGKGQQPGGQPPLAQPTPPAPQPQQSPASMAAASPQLTEALIEVVPAEYKEAIQSGLIEKNSFLASVDLAFETIKTGGK